MERRWLVGIAGVVCGALLIVGQDMPRVQAAAQSKAARLETVLREMDEASAKFQSAQADFQRNQFEKIVNDTTTETGKIYFQRKGGAMQMGEVSPQHVVEFKGGKARIYSPGTNQVQEYSVAGHEATAQAILTLGFGGSGKDLEQAWTIEDKGPEQMSDGSKTVEVEQLDLVSKDAGMRNNYTHVTIWVDPLRDVALKQIFFQKSGDTNTAIYKNVTLNKPVDIGYFAIKCKGKCG
jgi:outer membrane lipoprotein-sorting protein